MSFPHCSLWSGARTASRQKTNGHILASAQLVPWPQQGSEPLQASVIGWSLIGFVPLVLILDSKWLTMSLCLPIILFPRGKSTPIICPIHYTNHSSDWSTLDPGLPITITNPPPASVIGPSWTWACQSYTHISIPIDDWATLDASQPITVTTHLPPPVIGPYWTQGLPVTVSTPPSLMMTGPHWTQICQSQ